MKDSILSFLFVVLIEAIAAVINYLRAKLMSHLNRNGFSNGQEDFYA